jgi:lipopolysaccharide export system permease protein
VTTLHRYLLRQIIATLVMTAAVFTFVLLLGNVLRDILPLLVSRKASLGVVAQAFGLLVPYIWVFALPMGMLTSTLLVFGRFSADQELTAARASGVSLLSLVLPILILSLLLCSISAWVNLDLGPRSRIAFKTLLFDMRATLVNVQLPEGRPMTFGSNPAYTVYVERNRKRALEGVHLLQVRNETNLEVMVSAPRGLMEVTNQLLILHLYDARGIVFASDMPVAGECKFTLDLEQSKKTLRTGIGELTFAELRQEIINLERTISLPLTNNQSLTIDQQTRKRAMKKQMGDLMEPIRVQIHRRVAFSFACFGFTLIGIPLGIRMHRRETNVGIAVALLLVTFYYGLVVVAESLSAKPEFAPHLLIWLPNFLFQAVGGVLLWRANRGV